MSKTRTDATPEKLSAQFIREQDIHLELTNGTDGERSYSIPFGQTTLGSSGECQIVIEDQAVSRRHCVIERTNEGLRVVDLKSTNGTQVDGVVVGSAQLRPGSRIRVGNTTFSISVGYAAVPVPDGRAIGFRGMVGQSPAMRAIFGARSQLAESDATVLIQGETGTGKSALARSIHNASKRRENPFIVFDCAAVSPQLIEAALFGHEKGAFTGADQLRRGALESAAQGTLFIDELTELPLDLQPKLLRALEEREFKRVGSQEPLQVKCRIIAASQNDVWQLAEKGKFRRDLYYRLAVVVVPIPPLRDRREDLRAMVDHLLNVMEAPVVSFVQLPESVRDQIMQYDWPGNVRELRNYLERFLVTSEAPGVGAIEAQPSSGKGLVVEWTSPFKETKQRLLESFERQYLERLLDRCAHNLVTAAKESGLTRRHLYDLLIRYGLDRTTLLKQLVKPNDEQ